VARALGSSPDATLINEPDNEWPNPYALRAKLPLGQYPVLDPGDDAPKAYDLLWRKAFEGYRQARRWRWLARRLDRGEPTMQAIWRALCDHADPHVSPRLRVLTALARPPSFREGRGLPVVKSVHAPLAVEWVAERFSPRVVLIRRHPMNVLASWVELGWGDAALHSNPVVRSALGDRLHLPELSPDATALSRVAWQVGLFTSATHDALSRHPEWVDLVHDRVCLDPPGQFRALFERLRLTWSDEVARYLAESNRAGSGYRPERVAAEQPERWRTRLSPEQIDEAWSVLSRFDARWVDELAADVAGVDRGPAGLSWPGRGPARRS
jgi:hypothetical protein